ncbi:CCQ_1a_G0051320.mRNA.1.CDS.1 [Saccharomyces cerevisiae]|nr:Tim18p [Saccharomyces cerevisiae YJM541]AJT79056.1 Tim18p [Saccharomyces cerevisiae YJM554]AJT80518.1 Tim18p [Saccharomyces cerevisiae YJM681]AJT81509.1 Tim18p [Saccharomyces cerevisiae YJM683]AJT94644.1 Tim18p [Saccharomyces cerevisiae YJM1311]AJT95133.1 Tim18p [Saccharomyces cerevisiae YJM1326]AJU03469.1 Tim18p [Saccharomyces cerevisiae YJM1401]AJU07879.1 Tim18p [Saccharomyces cerevisiae YJM1443]AJU08373.1 Tim18p [Saccharomyces cerevisiae YJM1444]AJU08849.1 Tim18p [Saccharomyces cerev
MLLFPGLKPVLNASAVIVNPVRAVFPGLVLSTKRSFYSINRLNAENKINDIANTSKEASSSVQMFKPPEFSQFKDSYQKDYERIAKYTLIPLTMVPFYASFTGGVINPLLDASLSSIFLIYLQYGFTSCIIDYIPKEKYPRWHKLALYCLYGGSMLSLYGIYELETKNNGFVDLVKKLWNENDDHLYIFGRN